LIATVIWLWRESNPGDEKEAQEGK